MALIKCRECERDISNEAKTCPRCGCKTKERRKMSKRQKILLSVIAVVLIVVVVVVYSNNAWKRAFSVKYIGYENGNYMYEITNTSGKNLSSVYAVFHMQVWFDNYEHYAEFEFDSLVSFNLLIGETEEYTLRETEIVIACKEACKEGKEINWRTTPELVKITWD